MSSLLCPLEGQSTLWTEPWVERKPDPHCDLITAFSHSVSLRDLCPQPLTWFPVYVVMGSGWSQPEVWTEPFLQMRGGYRLGLEE